MELNDNKAGMKGLDKEKINKIITENSVGSKFYQNELKKKEQIKERIEKMNAHYKSLTKEEKRLALSNADNEATALDLTRDLSRCIVHVDMDAFYASVEERDRPELKTKPMAVGGTDMLSTSNYIARRFGVRAAMPGFIAKKLCPDLIIVPTNFRKYTEVSNVIREVLYEYDSDMTPMSLDEAYLDLTEYLVKRRSMMTQNAEESTPSSSDEFEGEGKNKFGTLAEEVVDEMRTKIFERTQLTASAGIACNALLAKVASDMNKPNGQFYLPSDRTTIIEFVKTLSIRKVGGVGKVTQAMLEGLDIHTCGDLYEKRMELFALFSPTMSNFFLRASLGIGSTHLEASGERKSVSTERTFPAMSRLEEMLDKLDELCESLEEDLKSANTRGLTLTLKYKTSAFKLHTRSKTLSHPIGLKRELLPVAIDLLKKDFTANKNNLKLRLLGVGLSKLSKIDEASQKKSIMGFFKRQELQRNQESASLNKNLCTGMANNKVQPVETEDVGNNKDDSINSVNIKEDSNDTTDKKPILGFFKRQELQRKKDAASASKELAPSTSSTIDPNDVEPENGANKAEDSINSVNIKEDSNSSAQLIIDDDDNQSNELEGSFTCPSCDTMKFKSIPLLNMHLDKCAVNLQTSNDENSNPSEMEFASTSNFIVCPICNATFNLEDMDLNKFNSHVDSCLNRETIKEIVESDRRRSTSNTQTQSSVRRKSSDSVRPAKKQKLDKNQCKISDFFNT